MIFRRLKAHVEKENWFAVAIDFAIVVIGVFIGLQVANWNEARTEKATGDFYLRAIGQDVASDIDALEEAIDGLSREADDAEIIIRYLGGEDVGLNDWVMFQMIYFRAGWTPFSPNRVTYDELKSAGQFRLIADPELRRAIGDYYAGLEDFAIFYEFQPPLRALIRGQYPSEAQRYMWQACFSNPSYRAGYGGMKACPEALDPALITDTLERLKRTEELIDTLRYVQSMRLIAMGAAPEDIEEAVTLSQRIESYLQ